MSFLDNLFMDFSNNIKDSATHYKELSTHYGKAYIKIEYNPTFKYIYNNWIGYVSVPNVQHGANACLEMLEKFKCNKILNDNRNLVGPWTEAVGWIENDWTPRAIESGLRYFAHIVTPGVFAEVSAANMLEKVNGKFTMKIFSEFEEAQEWLNELHEE